MNICVIGSCGAVGLTLSMVLCEKGFKIYGIDKNKTAWDQIKGFDTPFHEEGLKELITKHYNINFFDYEEKQEEIDAYIITVGTPLDENKHPNFEYLKEACKLVDSEKLVILRSTVAVGITEKLIEEFKLKYVAYCPERTIEGCALQELNELPQIIGVQDNASFFNASKIFCKLSPKIIKCTYKQAELAKLLCNTSRDMAFACSNILSEVCQSYGEDYNRIKEIATEGYKRVHIYRTDYVSGVCETKDSRLMTKNKHVIAMRDYNESLVLSVYKWIEDHIPRKHKIVLSGLAFKGNPDTNDIRDSHSIQLLKLLRKNGFIVSTHDYIINPVNLYDICKDAKLLLIMNNNKRYKGLDIDKINCKIFDSSNVLELENTITLGNYLIC